ncbi:MAG: AI-2E family transporter [Paludibacteraceae bacterium]|nr:AI-2E family transporter [Paludibacteraceae bacterium]
MMERRPFTLDRTVRLLISIAIGALLLYAVNYLRGVLLPFLVSWLLAYMIHPIVRFFQYRLKLRNRGLSVIVTLLLLIGSIAGIIALLYPLIATEVHKMDFLLNTYLRSESNGGIIPVEWIEHLSSIWSNMDLHSLLQNTDIQSAIKSILPKMWSVLSSSLNALMSLAVVFISILYLVFILMDYEKISNGWIHIIPPKYRSFISELAEDLESGMNRYFRGQALVAFSVGILFSIGFSIMGLPLAIIIGLFLGLLNMVPYLQVIGIAPCLLLGLLQAAESGTSYGLILVFITLVFVIVQCIQDLFLVPKIMGNVTGMNPAIILLSLSIWGALLGVTGMIIALPMTTLCISYYKRFVLRGETLPFSNENTPSSPTDTEKKDESQNEE